MTTPDAETLSALVHTAITSFDAQRPRSVQSREGILGPSDLGFCRQKALLTMRGTPQSDSKSIWAAVVGTAVGEYVEKCVKATFPDWLVGSQDNIRVTYTTLTGAEISGTPDIVVPSMNLVADLKTKDGFEWEERKGSSTSNKYQRHAYAKGLIAAGILDGSRPVYVANVYLDRSGQIEMPLSEVEEMDPMLDDEITQWVEDVIYARLHEEDASRDIVAPVCAKICEFFTVCRGGLPASESDVYEDPDIIEAVTMYVEGREMAAAGEKQRKAASKILTGLNGAAGGWQVRTTEVGETDVPGFHRKGYLKVEVVPIKGVK
jgi:hypothetical protein